MNKKYLKNTKGITIITLVITVVIMLILASVTITMSINGKLFEYSGEATQEINKVIEAQQEFVDGRIKIANKWYASLNDYLLNNPIKQGITIEDTFSLGIKRKYDLSTHTAVTGQLNAALSEIDGTITWSSDNKEVATVNDTGLVTAVKEGKAIITASIKYDGVTYSDQCLVTVEKFKMTAKYIYDDLEDFLGKKVDYKGTYEDASTYGNGEWEFFFADEKHIYIITKGYLKKAALDIKNYNGTKDFTAANIETKYPALAAGIFDKTYDPTSVGNELKYESDRENMKATQYLLDSTVWARYAKDSDGFGEWAIGGPTLELFIKSYNAYYHEDETLESPSNNGYPNPLSEDNSIPVGTYLHHAVWAQNESPDYWLAAQSAFKPDTVRNIYSTKCKIGDNYHNMEHSYRPVVCLDSDVQLIWDSINEQYTLDWATTK